MMEKISYTLQLENKDDQTSTKAEEKTSKLEEESSATYHLITESSEPSNDSAHQLLTESPQQEDQHELKCPNTDPVITNSSQLKENDEMELSPVNDTDTPQCYEVPTQSLWLNRHQFGCCLHWSIIVILLLFVIYLSKSALGEQQVLDLCEQVVTRHTKMESLTKNLEELKEEVKRLKSGLDVLEEKTLGEEQVTNACGQVVAEHIKGLEERLDDSENGLDDLSVITRASEYAIETLRDDLTNNVNLRVTDLEAEVRANKIKHDIKVERLERKLAGLENDIAELNSGFTKYIDDLLKKALGFFFPKRLIGNLQVYG